MFEMLSSLPANGPMHEQFSAIGVGTHREGLAVRFFPPQTESWVGNFQRGVTGLDRVLRHPDSSRVIVVAGGCAYVVTPATRSLDHSFGSSINTIVELPDLQQVVFGHETGFDAIGRSGLMWRTRRTSWDGIRGVTRLESLLAGEAYSPIDNGWHPFAVDLATGEVTGGSYIEAGV